jgi:hypothetical protein
MNRVVKAVRGLCDGVFDAVVLRSLGRLAASYGFGRKRHDQFGMLLLFPPKVFGHRPHIEIELLGIGVACASDFLNYRIGSHG